MAAIDLTTLDRVKTELGLTTTTVDDLLQSLITASSRQIMTQCARRFKQSTITKRFNGDATYGIALPNGPVTDVASVYIDGNLIPESGGPGDVGWTLMNDRVELLGYVFTVGVANVEITYTCGWATVPEDIERAAIELTTWAYQNRNHIGIQQRTVNGADSIQFRPDQWPYSVQMTVAAYRTTMGIAPFGGVEE